MLTFNYNDENDYEGVEDAKIQKVPPLFNDRNVLEWQLPPDKRYLKFADTQVKYIIEIPENYSLDNDVFGKLVENIEINISHESITHKSSSVDHAVTSFVLKKVNFDESYMASSMSINGYFDPK